MIREALRWLIAWSARRELTRHHAYLHHDEQWSTTTPSPYAALPPRSNHPLYGDDDG